MRASDAARRLRGWTVSSIIDEISVIIASPITSSSSSSSQYTTRVAFGAASEL